MPIYYRTRESGTDYGFNFVWTGTTYRIDIVQQPDYRGRATSMTLTHRLGSPGNWRICWTDDITTIDLAKTIAVNWAEGTDRYIRTGNSSWAFGQPIVLDYEEDERARATFARLEREQIAS